jgi:hypothetical protein
VIVKQGITGIERSVLSFGRLPELLKELNFAIRNSLIKKGSGNKISRNS